MKKIISLAVCFVMPFVLMGAKLRRILLPQLLHRHLSFIVPITTRLSVPKMQMKNEACEHYKNYDISHNA